MSVGKLSLPKPKMKHRSAAGADSGPVSQSEKELDENLMVKLQVDTKQFIYP